MAHDFDAVTCSRSLADLSTLQEQLAVLHPQAKLYVHRADLSLVEEVRTFCSFVASLARPVDVLVNNAGFFIPGSIVSEPDDVLRKLIDGNLFSAYHTTRGLIQSMRRNAGSYIFNMCSIASFMAYPNGGSYAISKFALLGFSKCLREELKDDGIRVSAVMPGATRTASWEGTDLPDERFIKPEDVAHAVYAAFSLSPRAVVEEIVIRPQLGDI